MKDLVDEKVHHDIKYRKIIWNGDRILGCQSINHTVCKGEPWQCERCDRIICWEEGYADDLVDLCDNCWYDIRDPGHELSIDVISTWKVGYETI